VQRRTRDELKATVFIITVFPLFQISLLATNSAVAFSATSSR